MKTYVFQLSTGLVFHTKQYIVFTQQGYCIDKQASDPEQSFIAGDIYLPGTAQPRSVEDMVFKSCDIVACWEE